MKVVINSCFGGFSLSPEATLELWKRGGSVEATPVEKYWGARADDEQFGKNRALADWRDYLALPVTSDRRRSTFITVFSPDESLVLCTREVDRADPILVALVEELGERANGACAKLRVVEVPDGAEWQIEEYDGNEHVAEKHRVWG